MSINYFSINKLDLDNHFCAMYYHSTINILEVSTVLELMDSVQMKDAVTVANILQAVPLDKRERLRDILSGYKAGLAEGIRLAAQDGKSA